MGILETAAELFRFSKTNNVNFTTAGMGVASSFTSDLSVLVGPSAVSPGFLEAGEAMALTVPPVARGAQLYGTAAAKMILKDPQGNVPAWLQTGTGGITPGALISGAVLSLMFHGKAVHFRSLDADGKTVALVQLPPNKFEMDMFGRLSYDGKPCPNAHLFIFTRGILGQGFLHYGKDAITHYLGLRDSILSRSRNPIPVVELKITDGFTATPEEIKAAQKAWQIARSSDNGAVALTPAGIDAVIHGDKADTSMLSEARNEVRKDVANYLNLNSSLLDGNSGQSDTYSNTLQDKDEFVDLSLDTFLLPLEQRFSQSDVSDVPLLFDREVFRKAVTPAAQGNVGAAVAPAAPEPEHPVSLREKEDQ